MGKERGKFSPPAAMLPCVIRRDSQSLLPPSAAPHSTHRLILTRDPHFSGTNQAHQTLEVCRYPTI